jgi:molecular chaperone GrpE (heat shock protein)
MKAKLTFELPEEQEEFNDAVNGNAFKAVIWELDQYMRSQIKHGDLADDVHEKVQEIRDQLHSILNDNKVMYE